MTVPHEKIIGSEDTWIAYSIYMTCFTEIGLSQTINHASKYGLLGIGVTRKFVLDRWGAPVWYVRNRKDEKIVHYLNYISLEPMLFVQELINRKILAEEQPMQQKFMESIAFTNSFIKNMSTADKEDDDFVYLDEHEWRIVITESLLERDDAIWAGNSDDIANQVPGAYKILLKPSDLKVLILPDDRTKQMALACDEITEWFRHSDTRPPLLTLTDCQNL
jgi:hypothetical protein